MRLRHLAVLAVLAALLPPAFPGLAAEAEILIRNHRFDPATLNVPAGERIRLAVRNMDATPEEFESYELNREKVVPGNTTIHIFIGPLQPGTYPFFGEFHPATARGRIIAK